MYVPRHDAHFAAKGVNDTRAIGAHQATLVLALEGVHDPNLVRLGDAFGDTDNKANFVLDSFNDGVGCGGRGYVENRSVGGGFTDCFADRAKYGEAEVGCASLFWGCSADETGAVFEGCFRVESALGTVSDAQRKPVNIQSCR